METVTTLPLAQLADNYSNFLHRLGRQAVVAGWWAGDRIDDGEALLPPLFPHCLLSTIHALLLSVYVPSFCTTATLSPQVSRQTGCNTALLALQALCIYSTTKRTSDRKSVSVYPNACLVFSILLSLSNGSLQCSLPYRKAIHSPVPILTFLC